MNNLITVDIIITNGIVTTIDSKGTIFNNGAIAIDKDIIVDIDQTDIILSKYSSENIIDAQKKIVMPGFVNSHTHLAMTIFRGLADDIKLSEWLNDHIFPAEKKHVNPQSVAIGTEVALAELIHGGTTCFNNMYYFEDVSAQIAKKAGFRGIISEGLIDNPIANTSSLAMAFEYTEMLLQKYQNDDLISVAVSAHSPYTCSSEMIIESKKLADKYNAPFHIHVAETKWEFDLIMSKYGLSPLAYLNKLGVLDKNTIIAHGVWLTDEDIEIIVSKNVGLVHNPECNMKISSGIARIPELLKAGAKIGLGTDGAASNNNLSMIQELHTMALLHKVNTMDPTVLPAEQVVRIATIGGARVLGMENKIGSLEIGKKADIIFIDYNHINAKPMYNVYSTIVYSLLGNEVSDVLINGKEIMRNYVIKTIDEKEIRIKLDALSKVVNN